jgi:hypothetical protein
MFRTLCGAALVALCAVILAAPVGLRDGYAADLVAAPVVIPLEGPAALPEAEISGLGWIGESLVLLPQYPERFPGPSSEGQVFVIEKARLLHWLEKGGAPLEPRGNPFHSQGLAGKIPGYEGYEALYIEGARAWLTMEAKSQGKGMQGFLVQAEAGPEGFRALPETLTPIPSKTAIPNMSYEALAGGGGTVLAIHEANGKNVCPEPKAMEYSANIQAREIPLPAIEYRVTDATSLAPDGTFWVLNFYWPGDAKKLLPGPDTFTGITGAPENPVERLLCLRRAGNRAVFTETPALVLSPGLLPRNWEGVARLPGKGFFIVTDKHPATILAFAPYPGA